MNYTLQHFGLSVGQGEFHKLNWGNKKQINEFVHLYSRLSYYNASRLYHVNVNQKQADYVLKLSCKLQI